MSTRAIIKNPMSQEFYVELEGKIEESSGIFPTILLRTEGEPDLQEMATQQGLAPLWSYFSASLEDQEEFTEEYGLPSDEELEVLKKVTPPERWCELEFKCPEQWFEPAEALKTIRGLLNVLRKNPTLSDVKLVIGALELTEQFLESAENKGVRFHFAAVAP